MRELASAENQNFEVNHTSGVAGPAAGGLRGGLPLGVLPVRDSAPLHHRLTRVAGEVAPWKNLAGGKVTRKPIESCRLSS